MGSNRHHDQLVHDARQERMKESKAFETDFELYKFLVEMADRVSARRGTANAFYVSAQTALITTLGLAEPKNSATYVVVVSCLSGVFLSIVWMLHLRSYRDLNKAKFEVICDLEQRLPWTPYADEWKSLKKDPVLRWRAGYSELTSVESVVPILFALLFIVQAVGRIYG